MTRKHEYAPMTNTPVMRGMQANLGNSVICGDCGDKMKSIPSESVDLIYMDPPFFSGRDYDDIWKDGAAMVSFQDTSFYKKVCGNPDCGKDFPQNYLFCPQCGTSVDEAKDVRMNDIEAYTGWLKVRLQECYRVLKQTGSIYVHLDWHAVHYVKVMMDEIFGMNNFRNEIVWCYNTSGKSKNHFGRKHDTIILYSKSKAYTFNEQRVKDDGKNAGRYNKIDEDGNKYYMRSGKYKVVYRGDVPVNDWWTDLPALTNNATERLGYPTQKPEGLLKRVINASSNPGDLVLDPFCGCGTAVAVAQKLGRRWIGIDVSSLACIAMSRRLFKLGYSISEEGRDVIDMPHTIDQLRNMEPFEFQHWVVTKMNGTQSPTKSGDRGIDGWTEFNTVPIQVKQSDKVGNPVVRLFAQDVRDVDKTHGIIIALSFSSGAYTEVDHIKAKYGIDIELKTATDLVD